MRRKLVYASISSLLLVSCAMEVSTTSKIPNVSAKSSSSQVPADSLNSSATGASTSEPVTSSVTDTSQNPASLSGASTDKESSVSSSKNEMSSGGTHSLVSSAKGNSSVASGVSVKSSSVGAVASLAVMTPNVTPTPVRTPNGNPVLGPNSIQYYVATNGNNANPGTAQAPWKTVAHALSNVEGGKGHIISVGAGTFDESAQLVVKTGTSLVGAGSSKTTIKVNLPWDLTKHPSNCNGAPDVGYDNFNEKFVVQVRGDNQTIKGFYLDGLGKTLHGGIFADNVNTAVFEDLRVENFRFAGIWVHTSNATEVRYNTLRNNGFYNNAVDTGDLLFYGNTGLKIHHNTIEETDPVRGPYGIKAYSTRFKNFCWWESWDANWSTLATNMEITDNIISVPELAGWTTGGNNVPGIVIEFNAITMQNVLIAYNTVNNVMSLVGSYANLNKDMFSARVLHNKWNLGRQYRYAIETNIPGLEVAYNHFDGGLYPLANWESNTSLSKHSIHHNIFEDPQGDQPLLKYHENVTGMEFHNNTIIAKRGFQQIFGGTHSYTGNAKNNIVYSTVSAGQPFGNINGSIENNLFFGFTPQGAKSITGNPNFVGSGQTPAPWYTLTAGSLAINAGSVIPGITDGMSGPAPDMGAFEFGNQVWTVGARF